MPAGEQLRDAGGVGMRRDPAARSVASRLQAGKAQPRRTDHTSRECGPAAVVDRSLLYKRLMCYRFPNGTIPHTQDCEDRAASISWCPMLDMHRRSSVDGFMARNGIAADGAISNQVKKSSVRCFIGGRTVDLDGLLLTNETTFWTRDRIRIPVRARSERHGRVDGRLDIVL